MIISINKEQLVRLVKRLRKALVSYAEVKSVACHKAVSAIGGDDFHELKKQLKLGETLECQVGEPEVVQFLESLEITPSEEAVRVVTKVFCLYAVVETDH